MTEPQIFLALPLDGDVLIRRRDVHKYGGPAAGTLAKWASLPSTSPCVLPYTLVGHCAAYSVSDLRKLREILTFKDSTKRSAARIRRERVKRETGAGVEAA